MTLGIKLTAEDSWASGNQWGFQPVKIPEEIETLRRIFQHATAFAGTDAGKIEKKIVSGECQGDFLRWKGELVGFVAYEKTTGIWPVFSEGYSLKIEMLTVADPHMDEGDAKELLLTHVIQIAKKAAAQAVYVILNARAGKTETFFRDRGFQLRIMVDCDSPCKEVRSFLKKLRSPCLVSGKQTQKPPCEKVRPVPSNQLEWLEKEEFMFVGQKTPVAKMGLASQSKRVEEVVISDSSQEVRGKKRPRE